jgi:hypothetical protein
MDELGIAKEQLRAALLRGVKGALAADRADELIDRHQRTLKQAYRERIESKPSPLRVRSAAVRLTHEAIRTRLGALLPVCGAGLRSPVEAPADSPVACLFCNGTEKPVAAPAAPRLTTPVRLVLRALQTATGPLYGRQIAAATGLESGTLYPILRRLEEAGWATAHDEEPGTFHSRPARRYYQLTDGAPTIQEQQ